MNNETQLSPRVAAGRRCYPKFEGLRVCVRENSNVFWREPQKTLIVGAIAMCSRLLQIHSTFLYLNGAVAIR
jgi:hypothetical protein